MAPATVSAIGTAGSRKMGGATVATPAVTAPVVVVAPVATSTNKTLMYVGLGLLAYMVLKNHKKI